MPTLLGADRDPGAIRASLGNARRAGVESAVRFLECPFEALDPPASAGLVVANAPYGDRVGSAQTLPWERWGALLDGRWSGWRFAWLVPGDLDPRRLGGETVVRFENGGIPVQLVCGG
jgi:23S rRNA G2445 N2-methylase RlmL